MERKNTTMEIIFIGIIIGLIIGMGVMFSLVNYQKLTLNTNVGDKICQDLAVYSGMNYTPEQINQTTSKSKSGELICNVPIFTYDHTDLIKFQVKDK